MQLEREGERDLGVFGWRGEKIKNKKSGRERVENEGGGDLVRI